MSTYGLGPYGAGDFGTYEPPYVPGDGEPLNPTNLRVVAYAPNGQSLGVLPTPGSVDAQFALNDVGALTMRYDYDAPRAAVLGQPLELATEVTWDNGENWYEPQAGRFLLQRDEADDTKRAEGLTISAPGYLKRLDKALVWSNLDAEGKRSFGLETPGYIVGTLITEAQQRGGLQGLTITWNGMVDSAGTPWPETHAIAYEAGKSLLSVLTDMADAGWVDFTSQGRAVHLYVANSPSGLADDRTVGNFPVTLRFGRDLTEAPYRRTWEALADQALVLGDNGVRLTRINPAASTPWGPQETFVTASGVTDEGTLNVLGDAALTFTERERVEHTLGLEFGATPHLPFRDYRPGQWVYAASKPGVAPERMRVMAITLNRNESGHTSGNVTLNDRFLDGDVLQNRRIQQIINGATQSGSGTAPSPSGPDILAPGQVLNLTASSAAYVDQDGYVRAQITLNWDDVTKNADGTNATDVERYEVWGRIPTQFDWRLITTTTVSQWYGSPFMPGETWEWRVRAIDTSYNFGAFSTPASTTTAADLTPPPEPSTPTATSRLGNARVSWDGKTVGGGDMAALVPDWRYVSVHVSQVNGFTPDDSNRVDYLAAPGYVVAGPLAYGVTYYARLVAFDSSGNASPASAQVPIVVAPLVDVSNFPDDAMETLYARTGKFLDLSADNFAANLIEGAWLKAGTITADKVSLSASADSIIPNGNFQDLNDAGTAPAEFYTQTWAGAGGVLGVETVQAISGTRSGKITMAGQSDAALLRTSRILPVQEGVTYYVRVRYRLSRTVAGAAPSLIFNTAPTEAQVGPFAGGTWQGVQDGAKTGGTVLTMEGRVTVPAGDKFGTAHVLFQATGDGAGYSVIVDDLELRPATTDSQITDITPGKIRTGILQATERIIAGTLSGARAELNGVGFQAFAPDGRKMFEVQSNSGETIVGDATGIHLRLGAFNSTYGGANQGLIRFGNTGSIYGDAQALAYYYNDGSTAWGALRLSGPYDAGAAGSWGNAAYLDLRGNPGGTSQFFLRATENNFSGNTFIFGSGDGTTIDFRNFGGAGFTLSKFDFTQRINVYWQVGFNLIRSIDQNGNPIQQRLQGSPVSLSANGHEVYWTAAGNAPILGHFERNIALAFYGGNLGVVDYLVTGYRPIVASAFTVSSDPRLKSDVRPVKGALKAIRSLEVSDYTMDGAMPRKATKGRSQKAVAPGMEDLDVDQVDQQVHAPQRARGVMADQVRAVLPDAVHEDMHGGLAVNLYDLLATTMAGLQELAAEVDTLKATQSPRRNP